MWQSIILFFNKLLDAFTSASETTQKLVPVIEKKQEIRKPVQEQEAKNDVVKKIFDGEDIIAREIRKDLKNGFNDSDIIEHYKQTIGQDVTYLVEEQKQKLINNKKRLKLFNKTKKNKL
jgi:hypothetical protein